MASSRLLLNTGWNLAGQGVPIIVAIAAVPVLIHTLGEAKFGILGLGWLVTGYFALFDFGISRATTRLMAALRQAADGPAHALAFWNSLYLHNILALLGGVSFALAVPWLVSDVFAIPLALREEAGYAFYWLAFSIPALVLASFLRGILESEHRFDLVNAVRIPAGILNYLGPVLALKFTDRVDLVIAVISLSRWLVTAAYAVLCTRTVSLDPGRRGLDRPMVTRLMGDGGWLTVASVVAPLIMVFDRLAIARLCSLEAVTHYVVPYEVITKLWILSASFLGAAFPRMSASRDGELRRLSDQSLRWLLLLTTPAAVIAIVFGREVLGLWVGDAIAAQSGTVLQWLAVGVWINVLAQVPLTTLQAAGRADIVGKIQLAELPLYAALVWWLVLQFGVVGAAVAWAIRALVDGMALNSAMGRTIPHFAGWPGAAPLRFASTVAVIIGAWLAASVPAIAVKFVLAFLLVAGLLAWQWRFLLTADERGIFLKRFGRYAAPGK
jgi:O-antigen/teichoic acid export membrane protein